MHPRQMILLKPVSDPVQIRTVNGHARIVQIATKMLVLMLQTTTWQCVALRMA